MIKKIWNMYFDPELRKEFKKKVQNEGRSQATVLTRFIQLYVDGKIKLFDDEDED
jgi:hypothetical protein